MPGCWARAVKAVDCVTMACKTQIQPGELVYLVAKSEIQTVCPACAQRRFDKAPPLDVEPVRYERPALAVREHFQRFFLSLEHLKDGRVRSSGGDR